MNFLDEILALLRLSGVVGLAAMEPEFNPLSPEQKLETRINTLVQNCSSFIFFGIGDLLLAWKIKG